jgi:hypothetical protein
MTPGSSASARELAEYQSLARAHWDAMLPAHEWNALTTREASVRRHDSIRRNNRRNDWILRAIHGSLHWRSTTFSV